MLWGRGHEVSWSVPLRPQIGTEPRRFMRARVPQEGIEAQRLRFGYSPGVQNLASDARSEERRVGKECRL